MEAQRSILVIGLLIVSFLLWMEYVDFSDPSKTVVDVASETVPGNAQQGFVPDNNAAGGDGQTGNFVPQSDDAVFEQNLQAQQQNTRLISVTTDTLSIAIDTLGGDVVVVDLLKYPLEQNGDTPYSILNNSEKTFYIAQSGLTGQQGPDQPSGRMRYIAEQSSYEMEGDTLVIPMSLTTKDGIEVTKTFSFTSGSHIVDVDYIIENTSSQPAQVQQYAQLKQTTIAREGGSMFMPIYRGAAYSTQDERYEKYKFSEFEDDPLRLATIGGWVGMLEHYFVSAWVPPQLESNTLYSSMAGTNAIIGYTGQAQIIQPGETATIGSKLYAGPKDQETLEGLARGLDLTVDYGFLWWISKPLFELLKFIQSVVINWGLSIIIITLLVKGAMYWLTKKQYESMAKMRALAPKLQQLKDRYGEDRQKMSQAMMTLYKKEKVNPMGGCFPLLLQMPIFLALYWVLLESVELRHAEFVFWITDLSVRDPFFVLPILTGASMFLLQKLQPMTIQDPLQQKIFQWMPVAMSIFFFFFPAGLVLYWLVSNVVTLVQAKMIYASMEKRGIKTH
ncbi:MAG: membrane protein insertase YidC [Pseudomonadota bacterium]